MNANLGKRVPSDSELLVAIKKGNSEAVEELWRRHHSALRRMTIGYLEGKGCRDPRDHAEEVKTRAWINIFRYLSNQGDVNKFNAWRDTIARNEAKEHLRSCINEQNTSVELEDETLLPKARINEYYESRDAAIDADKMLTLAKDISSQFVVVFQLHNVDELSFEEIADRLGKSKESVRSIYYRGLRRLKGMIKLK